MTLEKIAQEKHNKWKNLQLEELKRTIKHIEENPRVDLDDKKTLSLLRDVLKVVYNQ